MKRRNTAGRLTLTRIYANCSLRATGCRIWKGGATRGGYPCVYDPERHTAGLSATVTARSAVWRIKFGAVPDNVRIVTICRERCCVEASHLRAMTFQEAGRFASDGGSFATIRHCVARAANLGLRVRPMPSSSVFNMATEV